MKTQYKGYEIDVSREPSLGGCSMIYYTITRMSDGYECLCSFEDSSETVRDKIKHLKERINNEHEERDPWGELEESKTNNETFFTIINNKWRQNLN